ncbi:MAG: 2OG-Fe(II) oxygenase [Cyanobacteria bacterium J06597_1]
MIHSEVLKSLSKYRSQFDVAKPFRHLCIDNFFEPMSAEQALKDFPTFNNQKAINEFGKVGKKAVNTNISSISDFYSALDRYLKSQEFLSTISELTGISDLQPDPKMYGGGTHENLHGQGLDAHVDFNYDPETGYHRRLNLLLYLNKEWMEEWGGSIELHSNPRKPESNSILQFLPLFNRAVLFETNEYSWHGFPRINLPNDKRHLSRKCLSIYLYTKDRPENEIAPSHGTFYVQRQLPDKFQAGYTLLEDDMAELTTLLRQRDSWIERYQQMEFEYSAQIEEYRSQVRVPVQGQIQQNTAAIDYYQDGWIGPDFSVTLSPLVPVSDIQVIGYIPDDFPPIGLRATVNGTEIVQFTPSKGRFQESFKLSGEFSSPFLLSITADNSFCAAEQGTGSDVRKLVFVLERIVCRHSNTV